MAGDVPFYDATPPRLAGFRLDPSLTDDLDWVDDLEAAIADAMPGLALFQLERRRGLLLCDSNRLMIRDAYGLRSLRGEDVERFEQIATQQLDSRVPSAHQRVIAVDRVYGFDWTAFAEGTWAQLAACHRSTLGWIEADDLARWFNRDEQEIPHLWGSVEPVGLQVGGALEERLFAEWHRSFVAGTRGLPRRDDLT